MLKKGLFFLVKMAFNTFCWDEGEMKMNKRNAINEIQKALRLPSMSLDFNKRLNEAAKEGAEGAARKAQRREVAQMRRQR